MTYSLEISPYNPNSQHLYSSKEEEKEEAAAGERCEGLVEIGGNLDDSSPVEKYWVQVSPKTAARFMEDLKSGKTVIQIKGAPRQHSENFIQPLDDGEINAFFAREEAAYKAKQEQQISRITEKPYLLHRTSIALKWVQQMLSIAEKNKTDTPICKLENLLSLLTNEELEKLEFGPVLYKELKREMEDTGCDVIRGLILSQQHHEELLKAFKQIEQDLWRTTMVLTGLNGVSMLLSLSEHGAKTWQEIMHPNKKFPDLKYGHLDAAKDIGFPDVDLQKPQMAAYVVGILDHYLSTEGRLATLGKLLICNQFHQGLPLRVDARTAMPELLDSVRQPNINDASSEEEKQQDLKRRYHAYCLAHWHTGWNLPLFIEPGSDLDVAGFAAYANAQEYQDAGFKKSMVLHANLRERSVTANYLIQFTNPFEKRKITSHYYVEFTYGEKRSQQDGFLQERNPRTFPDLRKYLPLPKFCTWRSSAT